MAMIGAAVKWLGIGLGVAMLVGLLVRDRYRACYAFTLYTLAVAIGESLIALAPGRFWNWNFFVAKETLYAVLKLGTALEIGQRTVGLFPGARATARRLFFVLLLAVYLLILAAPASVADPPNVFHLVYPRLQNGLAWLFTAILAVVYWYRVPLNRFRKAILLGFVPYLLIATVAMRLIEMFGWGLREVAGAIDSSSYLLLLGYWTWAAWRRTSDLPSPRENAYGTLDLLVGESRTSSRPQPPC